MKKVHFFFNRLCLFLGLNMRDFIPLIGSIMDRGIDANISTQPTKDQLFQNCLFYPITNVYSGKQSLFVERRPGLPASGTTDTDYAEIDGFYHWKAVGTTLRYGYDNGGPGVQSRYTLTDSAGTTTTQTTGTNNRIFHVSEGKDQNGAACIFVIAAAAANKYTTIYMFPNLAGSDTNISVPSGSCGHIAYMDGYIFIGNTDGRIYNSTLNNPTTGYTDFIGSEITPGILITIFKYRSYILVFKTHGMEMFRIGEQTTGSPLQRIPELAHRIGIFYDPSGTTFGSLPISAPPIVNGNDTIYWLGQGDDGLGIYTMDETSPKKISKPEHDKYLSKYGGYIKYVTIGRRRLLLVYCTYEWLVYDIDLSYWSVWLSAKISTLFKSWSNLYNGEGLIGAYNNVYYSWTPGSSVPYLDIDSNITRIMRTSIIDFDTYSYKDIPALTVIGDKQSSTSNISLRWSKDDYQSWTTAKNIDMSSAFPTTQALGTSRRWAFEFSDTVQNPQRVRGFELEYNVHA